MTDPAFEIGYGIDVWRSDALQHEMLDWVDACLRERRIRRIGQFDIQRIRTWSAVFRFQTDRGAVWFKANSAISFHEIRLYPLLARVAPETALSPLAVDVDRGWMIVPDGGTILIHSATGGRLFDTLLEVVPQYARLQISLMPHVPDMLNLGVPDMRAKIMAQRFDEALADARDLFLADPTAEDIAILDDVATFRPIYREMCESLGRSKVPASLDHGDLHANNILPNLLGTPRIYDWGDSSLALHLRRCSLSFATPQPL